MELNVEKTEEKKITTTKLQQKMKTKKYTKKKTTTEWNKHHWKPISILIMSI